MSTTTKREVTRADILPMEVYTAERRDWRAKLAEVKRDRRVEVGPVATFYFETYLTMWYQIHEMLFIEKGGEDQIPDELAAYNPLVPKGGLGGVEETAFLKVGGETVAGVPEADVDRTSAAGKASSVQFVHFPFTPEQAAAFKDAGTEVVLGFSHPAYAHMTVLTEPTRAALAGDLD
jgi:hypothetical protein